MQRQWEKNQCTLNFVNENGEFVRQRYNHVIEEVTTDQIGALSQAIGQLKEEPFDHAQLTQVYRFEPEISL